MVWPRLRSRSPRASRAYIRHYTCTTTTGSSATLNSYTSQLSTVHSHPTQTVLFIMPYAIESYRQYRTGTVVLSTGTIRQRCVPTSTIDSSYARYVLDLVRVHHRRYVHLVSHTSNIVQLAVAGHQRVLQIGTVSYLSFHLYLSRYRTNSMYRTWISLSTYHTHNCSM